MIVSRESSFRGDALESHVSMPSQGVDRTFSLDIGGDRTTEDVLSGGHYQGGINPMISMANFPWRLRHGRRVIEFVDMVQHGFSETYLFSDALGVLEKRGLGRPIYEDGMLFGEQYPARQAKDVVMFPHEPVGDCEGCPTVVCIWGDGGYHALYLGWVNRGFRSGVLVAGVHWT